MTTLLSPHFSLEELTITEHREFDNEPNESERQNLVRLANFLEEIKKLLSNAPIMVNSAYRSAQVNQAVGSKPSSQHRLGTAADIRVPGMIPDEVVKAIIASELPYDQVIREFDRWTHVSIPNEIDGKPRRQALIIDKMGTRPYA
jgi:zinc D-Ala-D-Ala carboxypeptidase